MTRWTLVRLLVSLFLLLPIATGGTLHAATWSRSYYPSGVRALPSPDGGFVVCDGAWVMKLDPAGLIDWQKWAGGSRALNRGGKWFDATADGGAVVATEEDDEIVVVKFSRAGDVEWKRMYAQAASSNNGGIGIVELTGGGYAVVGVINSQDGVVLRLDAGGSILWQKVLPRRPTTTDLFPVSVKETSNGDLVVAAAANVTVFSGRSNVLFRLDSAGNLLWRHTYDDTVGSGYLFDVVEVDGGDLVLVGDTTDFGDGLEDLWVVRVDSSGGIVWQKTLGGFGSDLGGGLTATGSGAVVVAATTNSYSPHGLSDGWLIKIDATGNVLWQRAYGEEAWDRFESVAETSDGGLLVAGTGGAFGPSGNEGWVLLLDDAGGVDSPCPLVLDTDDVAADTAVSRVVLSTAMGNWSATWPPVTPVVVDTTYGYSEHCPCTTCRPDPFEHDDACLASRSTIRSLEAQDHNFWADTDDWVAFNACAGRTYTIETLGLGASADTVLWLYDTDCASFLDVDDDGGTGLGSRLSWTSPADGLYHLRVEQANAQPGVDREYTLQILGDTTLCSRWTRALGGVLSESVEDGVAMPDGTLVVAGGTRSWGTGGEDGWLLNLDPSGLVLWERTFGGAADDRFETARRPAASDDVLLGGSSASFGSDAGDAWIVRVDPTGAPAWSRTFDDFGTERVTVLLDRDAIVSRSSQSAQFVGFGADGTFEYSTYPPLVSQDHELLGGESRWVGWINSLSGDKDLWIQYGLDRIHGGAGTDVANASADLPDLGFVVVGSTDSYGAGGLDVWVLRYDAYDRVNGEVTLGGVGDDEGVDVIATRDGGFVVAATTDSFGAGGTDVWLIAFGPVGGPRWQRTYGGPGSDRVTSIAQTPDDGFAVTGVTTSFGAGSEDGWVLRLGPDGALPDGCPVSGAPGVTAEPAFSPVGSEGIFFTDYASSGFQSQSVTPLTAVSTVTTQCFETCPNLDGDPFSACQLDCDDTEETVYAGAPQICDGLNNDCDDPDWPDPPADEVDVDLDTVPLCADCDDGDPWTYPGADEINDGDDNQCPGDAGYGLIDEISGFTDFTNPGDNDTFCWPPQIGATRYQIARSTGDPSFGSGCTVAEETGSCHTNTEDPPVGEVFYYVVRALEPNTGSWGEGPGGERVFTCGAESDCSNQVDDDADGQTDCEDIDCSAAPECIPAVFTFTDTAGDDVVSDALYNFFAGLSPARTDWMLFEIIQHQGEFALCLGRADLYVRDYLM